MESDVRNKVFRSHSNGNCDLTFRDTDTLNNAVCAMYDANQFCAEMLQEASGILRAVNSGNSFPAGNNPEEATAKLSDLLGKAKDFHKELFGDESQDTATEATVERLVKWNGNGVKSLNCKRFTDDQLKEYEQLESKSAKAWEYYQLRAKKKEKLEAKLAKTLTVEALKQDNKLIRFRNKMKLAWSQYSTCLENKAKFRDVLAEKTQSSRQEFHTVEKKKMDTMFASVNSLLKGLVTADGTELEPEVPNANAAAQQKKPKITEQKEDLQQKEKQNIIDDVRKGKKSKESTVEPPPFHSDGVVWKHNVTVYALENREKENSTELTLKKGMKLKQVCPINEEIMSYGCKRTMFGRKKYGFYPATLVALTPPDKAEKKEQKTSFFCFLSRL